MSKRVLFVASREGSYSRVAHYGDTLKGAFLLESCVSNEASYSQRIPSVLMQLLCMLCRQHYDMLVVGFCAQVLVFPVFLVYRGTLVIDGFVSLYDTLILDRKVLKQKSLAADLILWLERTVLSCGDIVTVDTEEHLQFYNRVLKVPLNRLKVVPVTAQETEYRVDHNGEIRSSCANTFNVLFFGSFLPLQGVDIIAESVKYTHENVKFTLIGSGAEHQKIVKILENEKRVTFVPWIDFQELGEYIKSSHLVLGVFGKNEKTDRVIPNKVVISLYHRKAILTLESSAMLRFFQDNESVFYIEHPDSNSLANRINQLSKEMNRIEKVAHKGRLIYDQVFSYKISGDCLIDTLEQVYFSRRII